MNFKDEDSTPFFEDNNYNRDSLFDEKCNTQSASAFQLFNFDGNRSVSSEKRSIIEELDMTNDEEDMLPSMNMQQVSSVMRIDSLFRNNSVQFGKDSQLQLERNKFKGVRGEQTSHLRELKPLFSVRNKGESFQPSQESKPKSIQSYKPQQFFSQFRFSKEKFGTRVTQDKQLATSKQSSFDKKQGRPVVEEGRMETQKSKDKAQSIPHVSQPYKNAEPSKKTFNFSFISRTSKLDNNKKDEALQQGGKAKEVSLAKEVSGLDENPRLQEETTQKQNLKHPMIEQSFGNRASEFMKTLRQSRFVDPDKKQSELKGSGVVHEKFDFKKRLASIKSVTRGEENGSLSPVQAEPCKDLKTENSLVSFAVEKQSDELEGKKQLQKLNFKEELLKRTKDSGRPFEFKSLLRSKNNERVKPLKEKLPSEQQSALNSFSMHITPKVRKDLKFEEGYSETQKKQKSERILSYFKEIQALTNDVLLLQQRGTSLRSTYRELHFIASLQNQRISKRLPFHQS